jgi:hypothetical protein
MELLGADYTTTTVNVTVPAGATTGTVSVPTTADTIDDNEDFTIASELRLLEQSMIMTMRLLWQRSLLLRLLKDLLCVFSLTLILLLST